MYLSHEHSVKWSQPSGHNINKYWSWMTKPHQKVSQVNHCKCGRVISANKTCCKTHEQAHNVNKEM